jgi:hypothetical protein
MKKYLTAGILSLITIAVIISYPSTTTSTPLPPPPPPCDFACLIEKRTMEIFERDRNEYLEHSRIKALTEINKQSQDMIYDSPYTEAFRP